MDKALFLMSGRLAGDPEIKSTPSGHKVCRFAIAVNTPRGSDRSKTSFFECEAWDDVCRPLKDMRKGQNVEAWGDMCVDSYTDKSGSPRRINICRCAKICWVTGMKDENKYAEERSRKAAADVKVDDPKPEKADVSADDETDDDLPF